MHLSPKNTALFFLLASSLALSGCRKSTPTEARRLVEQSRAQGDPSKKPENPAQSEGSPAKADALNKDVNAEEPKAPEPMQAKPSKLEAQVTRPLYYDRKIEAKDLEGRSLREFSLLRNTIFARAGNQFRKTWLDQYFRAQPWYKPLETMNRALLTKTDLENVERIVDAEQAIKREELEKRRDALLANPKRNELQAIELRLLSVRLGQWAGGEQGKDPNRTPLEDPSLLDKLLDLRNLKELSRRDLRILRNTIYARRGRSFSSPIISSYFHQMQWYEPKEQFKGSMLRDVDRKNIRIVRSLEHSLGGPIRDKDHPEADWMYLA